MRVRLLEQTLGARQLESNSDLGLEMERIWQQFLQRSLGAGVRCLTGGVITDYEGNQSKHQLDLIVTPAEAQVTFPGDSEGKSPRPHRSGHIGDHDQIHAQGIGFAKRLGGFEGHSPLSADGGRSPYPAPSQQDRPHAWPLRYIIGSQSDPTDALKLAWEKAVAEQAGPVPELVVTLDSGFYIPEGSCWPRPRYPSNYTEPDQVMVQTGNYSGLGLAWLITQHQARLAIIQRRATGPIQRLAQSLDTAMLTEATPFTHSMKFDSMFRMQPIAGQFQLGIRHQLMPIIAFRLTRLNSPISVLFASRG